MGKKVVFCLLILCVILSQGICTSSEETENASNLHIRKKRVIGDTANIREARYLISLVANIKNYCPATILTDSVAITSAECFHTSVPRVWQIRSGSTYHHQVRNVIPYGNYNSSHPTVNNLALVFFYPPINIRYTHNRPIKIFSGNLPAVATSMAAIFNWDHKNIHGEREQSSTDLKKTLLLLISYEYCHNYYPDKVRPGNICAQNTIGTHQCQLLDTGAPLVINNELLGIFVYRGQNCQTNPDVFMNLLDHDIRQWIHRHVPTLNLY